MLQFPKLNDKKEYVSFLKELYSKNINAIKEKAPLTETIIKESKALGSHFAKNFKVLKDIADDDYFEYNHAMLCAITYFSYLERRYFQVDEAFLKEKHILNSKDTMADVFFLLHHIDNLWKDIELEDLEKFKLYILEVHSKASYFLSHADDLDKFDRWNLIKCLKSNFYTLSPNGIMYATCRAAFHLRYLEVGKILKKHIQDTPELLETEVQDLRKWVLSQETYFSIRKFRMRMIQVLWNFMNDEPSRNYYTYTRAGEIPTKLAHVTSTYPSQWISAIQHELLYGKPLELLEHSMPLLQDSLLIALFEAHFKTHYNIAWTKYCLCIEDDILEAYGKLIRVEHPMILKVWGHFYILWNSKLYKCGRFDRAMVLWCKLLKEHCRSTIFKNINCSNTINRILPPPAEQEPEQDNGIFDVYL